MSILVVGETCLDVFRYGRCERLAPEAPVPVFNPVGITDNPGMAMNVQKNIEALGATCDIYTNHNWKSVLKTRFIHKDTNQMFIRVDENEDQISRCSLSELKLSSYEIIVVSDYCKGFLSEDDIRYITENHDCVFVDTKKRLGAWCKSATFIKINNIEYNKTKDYMTSELKEKLIVTRGSKGCVYRGKTFPVKSVEIKDVSGAGDTFLSGLVVNYQQTRDIHKAIEYANECATVVVQKRGVSTV